VLIKQAPEQRMLQADRHHEMIAIEIPVGQGKTPHA
jgi:hypothetical protein